jgi:hypothetical protein
MFFAQQLPDEEALLSLIRAQELAFRLANGAMVAATQMLG